MAKMVPSEPGKAPPERFGVVDVVPHDWIVYFLEVLGEHILIVTDFKRFEVFGALWSFMSYATPSARNLPTVF